MAVTDDPTLADRMRQMSLHGLSHDAWGRYAGGGAWDYRIVAPGYKYNLTDMAAAIGMHQLARAEAMRLEREAIAAATARRSGRRGAGAARRPGGPHPRLAPVPDPPAAGEAADHRPQRASSSACASRASAARSTGGRCTCTRTTRRRSAGGRSSLPVATPEWPRLVSLPIFPGMREHEQEHVVAVVRELCARYADPKRRRGGFRAQAPLSAPRSRSRRIRRP